MTRPARCFDAFEINGQRYEHVGEVAHTRTDGKIAVLITWQSLCLECSEPFTTTKPDRPAPPHPTRRCKRCAQAWLDMQSTKRLNRNGNLIPPDAAFTPAWQAAIEGERTVSPTASTTPRPRGRPPSSISKPPPSTNPSTGAAKPRKPGVFTDR